jgi:hypothetical protein
MANGQLIQELREIKRDIHFIKEHMIDIDTILTPKEEADLNCGLKELEEGKAVSLDIIKRDRNA